MIALFIVLLLFIAAIVAAYTIPNEKLSSKKTDKDR
jgi:hypothetical protein